MIVIKAAKTTRTNASAGNHVHDHDMIDDLNLGVDDGSRISRHHHLNQQESSGSNIFGRGRRMKSSMKTVGILALLMFMSFMATNIDRKWIHASFSLPLIYSTTLSRTTLAVAAESANNMTTYDPATTITDHATHHDHRDRHRQAATGSAAAASAAETLPSTSNSEPALTKRISANLTLVVQVAGELGNHFYYINRGVMLARMAQEAVREIADRDGSEFELKTTILLRQQSKSAGTSQLLPKAVRTENDIRQCFHGLQNISFHFGHSDEYKVMLERQARLPEWDFLSKNETISEGLHSLVKQQMRTSMKDVVEGIYRRNLALQESSSQHLHQLGDNSTTTNTTDNNVTETTVRWFGDGLSGIDVSLPIINVKRMAMFSLEFEHELRQLFRMNEDDPVCCNIRADPNETVFHYRNFIGEMKKYGEKLGFGELSPFKIASELFHDLHGGDKVAIVTRIKNEKVEEIRDLIQSLHPGVEVRIVDGNSGVQDFCLLKTTQKEIIGTAKSTFVRWASFLGNQRRARLYIYDSMHFRANARDGTGMLEEPFELIPTAGRIRYEIYRSDNLLSLLNNTNSSSRVPELKGLDEVEKLIQVSY